MKAMATVYPENQRPVAPIRTSHPQLFIHTADIAGAVTSDGRCLKRLNGQASHG